MSDQATFSTDINAAFEDDWTRAQDLYRSALDSGYDPSDADRLYLSPIRDKWKIAAAKVPDDKKTFDRFQAESKQAFDRSIADYKAGYSVQDAQARELSPFQSKWIAAAALPEPEKVKPPTEMQQRDAMTKRAAEDFGNAGHTDVEMGTAFPDYFKKGMGGPLSVEAYQASMARQDAADAAAKALTGQQTERRQLSARFEQINRVLKADAEAMGDEVKLAPEAKQKLIDEAAFLNSKISAGTKPIAPTTPFAPAMPQAPAAPAALPDTGAMPSPFAPSPFTAPATATGTQGTENPIPDAPADPKQRKMGQKYVGKGGKIAIWTGTGWQLVK
jgi:hypothetical protein